MMWTPFCWLAPTRRKPIPVVGAQIRQAVQNGTQLIVVDPRDIGLAKSAAVHLKLTSRHQRCICQRHDERVHQ